MSQLSSAPGPDFAASYGTDALVARARRVAFQLARNEGDADDLVQDAVIARLTHAPGDGVPETAWLRRVIHNFSITRFRRDTRRRRWESVPEARESTTPEQALACEEASHALVKLIFTLPDAQREVVLLRYFEGLESAQIGERLGVPAGTVRWRLKEALDSLRAEMSAKGGRDAWLGALVPLVPLVPTSPNVRGSTRAIRNGLFGKLAAAGAWTALVLALGIGSGPNTKLLPEQVVQAEEPAVVPVPAQARPFFFGGVPGGDPDEHDAIAMAKKPRAGANDDSTSSSGASSDEESNAELLKEQILKLGKSAWGCGHLPIEKHSAVFVHVAGVVRGGVGRVAKAELAPDPFAAEHPSSPPNSADMNACVLAIVRAHEFALPTDGPFEGTGIVPVLPELDPALKKKLSPEEQQVEDETRTYMHMDVRELGTKLIKTCAQKAGDLPPTSSGVVRYTRAANDKPITVAIHVDKGEQNFPGIVECARGFIPAKMLDVMLIVGDGTFELPFDGVPARRTAP